MPRPLRAAGCVTNSITTNNGRRHIWISDELLAETFQSFARCHHRYGSNIPGPLEARRRASKRRNTSLARHDFTAPTIDPSVIWGSAPQEKWWQKQAVRTTKASTKYLPPWLFGNSERADDDASVWERKRSHRNGTSEVQRKQKCRWELQQCSTLASIRDVVAYMDINFRAHPELAETAFRQLLHFSSSKSTAAQNDIAEFLTDPSLNPPGSANHLIFMEELGRQELSSKSWDSWVMSALQHAIKLGVVDLKVFQQITLLLPQCMKSCGLTSRFEDGKPVADWLKLLTSLENSHVVKIQDLDKGFRRRWVELITSTPISDKTMEILWKLRSAIMVENADLYAEILTLKLMQSIRDGPDMSKDIPKWFAELSRNQRGTIVLLISQKMISATLTGEMSEEGLEIWWKMIFHLSKKFSGSLSINQKNWDEAIACQSTLTSAQSQVSMAWTVSSLSAAGFEGVLSLKEYNFAQQFSQLFPHHNSSNDTNLLQQTMLTLNTLPLPDKDRLHQALSVVFDADLSSLCRINNYEKPLKQFVEQDFRVFNEEEFHYWARQNSSTHLATITDSFNGNIPALTKICQTILMNDKTKIKIVRRLLEHNLPMKLAVSTWQGRKHTKKGVSHVLETEMTQQQQQQQQQQSQKDSKMLDRKTVLKFVHDLATTASISPVLSKRSSFRTVHYFYLWLHRYGAPIHPSMSKALWHAGVTRYGDRGCPNTQLKWCLKVVEEVEGSEVARSLLWNKAFRRERAEEMETIMK